MKVKSVQTGLREEAESLQNQWTPGCLKITDHRQIGLPVTEPCQIGCDKSYTVIAVSRTSAVIYGGLISHSSPALELSQSGKAEEFELRVMQRCSTVVQLP